MLLVAFIVTTIMLLSVIYFSLNTYYVSQNVGNDSITEHVTSFWTAALAECVRNCPPGLLPLSKITTADIFSYWRRGVVVSGVRQ